MRVFHTFYKEFKGENAAAVVAALYADSREGTDMSYDAWWTYQQNLWAERYDMAIPAATAPDAADALLATLLAVGALEDGPLPQAGA